MDIRTIKNECFVYGVKPKYEVRMCGEVITKFRLRIDAISFVCENFKVIDITEVKSLNKLIYKVKDFYVEIIEIKK